MKKTKLTMPLDGSKVTITKYLDGDFSVCLSALGTKISVPLTAITMQKLVDFVQSDLPDDQPDDQPTISKYAVKVTFPSTNLVLYIHRDPDHPDQPMYLGFGWETTSRVSEAWTTPNEGEARILLGRWRRSMRIYSDAEGEVVVIDDQPTDGEV